ncbi:NB-ARC domain-containing protein, partial [Bacillus cereus]
MIERIQEKCTEQSVIIIGIDGCGGAGKSTLANKIKSDFSTVTVVYMDDFYLPYA